MMVGSQLVWADFDKNQSTTCQDLHGLMGLWMNGQGNDANWIDELLVPSQLNPGN